MNISIVHYHLFPGGVTRIIGSQINGLLEADPAANLIVLCGNSHNQKALSGVPVYENVHLQYQDAGTNFENESALIKSFISQKAKGSILHCHNANLGKNPALTFAIYQLAMEGFRIVNHCHDFAEDRPRNMEILHAMTRETGLAIRDILYPDMRGYHFVVLNSCDYERLLQEDIPAERLHLLPNPVSLVTDGSKQTGDLRSGIISMLELDRSKMICTYPVRGIKRKNIGEFILIAILFESTCQFVITQAPKNPEELPGYERWKEFSIKYRIGIKFEAGEIVNHEDLIRISDFCMTTSTREGFGMVFLEPWLAGTPVSGRNLGCITKDLRNIDLKFPGLYNQIMVKTTQGTVDFKDLKTEEQEEFIITLQNSSAEREKIMRMNPVLKSLFEGVDPEIIRHNREIIINNFSVLNYGKRLFEIYKNISG